MKRLIYWVLFILVIAGIFTPPRLTTASEIPSPNLNYDIILQPDLPGSQPVGTTITWEVLHDIPNPSDIRLSIGISPETMRVRYDYGQRTTFPWTPLDDRDYTIVASVRDRVLGTTTTLTATYTIDPIATTEPVITPTDNALIVIYSAPPCQSGRKMRVLFKPLAAGTITATQRKGCDGLHSMNYYVAGMRQQSTYLITHQLLSSSGQHLGIGSIQTHLTGNIFNFAFPERELLLPPDPENSSVQNGINLVSPLSLSPIPQFPYATDLAGRIIWLDARYVSEDSRLFRSVPGGTFLYSVEGATGEKEQLLREVDLNGHILRETNAERLTEQLQEMGYSDFFGSFHHEARRLPNGDTVIIGSAERILIDIQGPGEVNVTGDWVVVLNTDWQVKWAWLGFDHLDPSRMATLGEVCYDSSAGCPNLWLGDQANDWMHANAVDYSPSDGNLILSLRHQDWVIKLDYQNGAGNGDILWRLGREGDFTLTNGSEDDWHSHQHDPNWVADSNQIVMFDNGNLRCVPNPDGCVSRGQVYELDEVNMTATLLLNVDLGHYDTAFGTAEPLSNGNFHFFGGVHGLLVGAVDEIGPDGSLNYSLEFQYGGYRDFRLSSLYAPLPAGIPLGTPELNLLDRTLPAE